MDSDPEKKGFFACVAQDVLLVARNNKALLVLAVLIPVLFSPLAAQWREYRVYLDQQILYNDPDLTVIEGEGLKASNTDYWINKREYCFADKYMAFYGPVLPKEGYLSFKYVIPVKKPGTYKIYLAGSPPGSEKSGIDTYFCPFAAYLDNNKVKDFNEENNRGSLLAETGSLFYATYEYALVFRITKLGEFRLEPGEHELEFRVYDKAISDKDYKFYADAIFLVPSDWKPKKRPFSLAEDLLTH